MMRRDKEKDALRKRRVARILAILRKVDAQPRTWTKGKSAWIKQSLAQSDSSFAKLTRLHGVKKQNIALVKHFPYPKYERLIAKSVGLDPWDLWPHRYDVAHNPNRISSRYQGHKHFLNDSRKKPKVKEIEP